jgi:calcineurin-like phosphoesterase family protein
MKTHFTADTHFEHEGILEMAGRPFVNIEEHNSYLIDRINETVGRDDRLFIVGDFGWRAEDSWFGKIRCKNVHLVFGNHDKARLGKLFKTAEDTCIVKIQEQKVFLSHYPHAYWPAAHYGSLHLYGHVHAEREETLDLAFPGRRSMDCGLDNAKLLVGEYRPFTEDEIIQILMARPGHDHVEFYTNRQAARQQVKARDVASKLAKHFITTGQMGP